METDVIAVPIKLDLCYLEVCRSGATIQSPQTCQENLQAQHEYVINMEDGMEVLCSKAVIGQRATNATLIVGPSGRVRTWFRRHFETAECLRYLLEHEAQISSRKYGESAYGPGQRERVVWMGRGARRYDTSFQWL